MTESGGKDDSDVRTKGHTRSCQFKPCHVRHGLVGHYEVEPAGIVREKLQGFNTAVPDRHLVTEPFEKLLAGLGQRLLIVNEEYPFVPGRGASSLMASLRGCSATLGR